MKEHSIAVSVSLLFHIIIVALFLRVPFDQYIKPKIMVLDFSLEKGRVADGAEIGNRETEIGNRETEIGNRETEIGNRESEIVNRKSEIGNRKSAIVNRKSKIENRTTENEGTIINREQNIQRKFAAEASLAKQNNGNTIASEPAGQVVIHGDISHAGVRGETVTESDMFSGKGSQNIAASSGKGKILNFEDNGADEKDFAFIRDTILKRIKDKYPDRARRMGWEGKVLLSFVVLENGSINNVKVVNSSGFRILDNSAKEVIEKTTFTQKIPYSRTVLLAVGYRQQ